VQSEKLGNQSEYINNKEIDEVVVARRRKARKQTQKASNFCGFTAHQLLIWS
jgi:hypothetical protein